MSEENLAKRIAEMLKPAAENAAKEAVGLQVKKLEDVLGTKIDECIDGKCDFIATKTAEKLQPEIQAIKSKVEGSMSIKGHTPHDIWDCPTCKPITMDHLLKNEKHRGDLLEMVCKDAVCKPIVTENLWKDEDYRKDLVGKLLEDENQMGELLGRICENEECRKDLSKIFDEKKGEEGVKVIENGERREETWAQRRLRERREKAGKTG